MSAFLNTHFHPATPFDPEQITCAAGVTALNETCAMLACDPGEAIMLGMPIYGSFSRDLTLKTGYVDDNGEIRSRPPRTKVMICIDRG